MTNPGPTSPPTSPRPTPGTPRISVSTPTSTPLPPSLPPSRAASPTATLSPHPPSPLPRKTHNPRTRTALRSFYQLTPSPLDTPHAFDAAAHLASLLETHSPAQLLSLENRLVTEIRGLDGDRKALVYDNYSKLIDATETIRRMRRSMEPLAPTTRTMEPAVAHIEAVARSLLPVGIGGVEGLVGMGEGKGGKGGKGKGKTVEWVLGAAERVERLRRGGREEEAKKVVERVNALLEVWEARGVDVAAVRERVGKAAATATAVAAA
ncbi:Vps51/Vps67-domain-containing protein [Geopyxis carbonaria]|nr:Vps51/Vps67-domain-containing protein [Geopyxis carbonaria]